MAELAADGLTDGERAELEGENQPKAEMSPERFSSIVRDLVYDAEEWIENDISPDRDRAHRYYKGECDVEHFPGRSSFVMRVVRDTVEQLVPLIMKTFTGGTETVVFRSTVIDEQKESAAADATAAFEHYFWNKNPGWMNLQDFVRDALKAKTGIFKAFHKEEIKVIEGDWQGSMEEFVAFASGEDVEVLGLDQQVVPGIVQTPMGPMASERVIVDALVKQKQKTERLVIETIPPEEHLINRAATSLEYNDYTLTGQKSIKMVSEVIELVWDAMAVLLMEREDREATDDEILAEIVKHAGSGTEGASGDYQEQERRNRRKLSSDPYEGRTNNDDSTKLIAYYELYIRVDKDQDGFGELRRVVGIGEGPGLVVEDSIVDGHPYFMASAIPIEHSAIGNSVADNVWDLQDVETQITRQINDNLSLVNNPRRWAVKKQYDRKSLIDNQFNGFYEVSAPNSVGFDQTPFIGDKALLIREAFNETRAERTGVSKESMGLAAQNLQSSSEIGVLAVLGAGLTQPDMISANIAHAMVPLAKEVVRLLKESGEPINIKSDGVYREVDPSQWPDDMEVEVMVGLGTGNRDQKLGALSLIEKQQREILLTLGPDNPITTVEQYTHTLHQIAKMTGIGQSTSFYNTPEEVRKYMQAKSQEPPKPDPAEQQAKLEAETDIREAEIKAEADLMEAQIKAEVERQIAALNLEQEGILRIAEMAEESRLTELAIENDVSSNTNLRRS